jgi:hypothetical protein
MQTQLPVGDTTPATIPTHKIGAIVTLVQCAHRLDSPPQGWRTHDPDDVAAEWVLENVEATVARLLADAQAHSTREQPLPPEAAVEQFRTTDATAQASLPVAATDGGKTTDNQANTEVD